MLRSPIGSGDASHFSTVHSHHVDACPCATVATTVSVRLFLASFDFWRLGRRPSVIGAHAAFGTRSASCMRVFV
jgi:hypothetical protein